MPDFFESLAHRAVQSKRDDERTKLEKIQHGLVAGHNASQLDGTSAPPLKDVAEHRSASLELLTDNILFDPDFYLKTYPDIAGEGIDPLGHFLDYGSKEGRRPNPYFEPLWYLARYPEVNEAGMEPLFHYAIQGDKANRWPGPLFNTPWYRKTYNIGPDECALAHYLKNRTFGSVSPIPEFDVAYYLRSYPDIAAAGCDPFEHFVGYGWREGRNPSADLDIRFYQRRYLKSSPSTHPFFDWLSRRDEPGVFGRMPDEEVSIPREVKRFTQPGPDFEDVRPLSRLARRRAKILAFYLPQFHSFIENDAWWGKGFTEWSNVPRGLPRFPGHYQPRVPRDLGFYGLDDSSNTMQRQIELAKGAGVHGFVFYYYWFNGKRLMEKPIERFLGDRSLDLPFCLMWANENWTRRWDGAESGILISQDYRANDDATMIAEFVRHMADPRYIRAQGRPLLMLYRPGVIPNCAKTVSHWRKVFREVHREDPVILMAQAFGDTNPESFGLDGAVEFPPHKLTQDMRPVNDEIELLDVEFLGNIYNYDAIVQKSLLDPEPSYPLVKTVVPSWDNDARRQGARGGVVVTGSTPAKYEAWLTKLIDRSEQHPLLGEPIVCINAWNEWCEGAYLEPDLHFGGAYLNATARAVTAVRGDRHPRLLLVGHDAFPSGAQHLLLSMGRMFQRSFGFQVEFLLLDGGALDADYVDAGPTTLARDLTAVRRILNTLAVRGFCGAIVNTCASARIIPELTAAGFRSVLLVHESPRLLRDKCLIEGALAGFRDAAAVVFPATYVRDEVVTAVGTMPANECLIMPQGLYKRIDVSANAAADFRAKLCMNGSEKLVIGIGYADLRKGFDLFLQLWRYMNKRSSSSKSKRVHFAWIGSVDPTLQGWLAGDLEAASAQGSFHLLGYLQDVMPALSAAQAFALTSREDPFPTVALEALSVGIPVVAFERSGGVSEMLRARGVGKVVEHADVGAMADALKVLLREGRSEGEVKAAARRALVSEHFAFRPYVRSLGRLAIPQLQSVSVAVPNYNYAQYMPERLGAVFHQNYPVEEILVLDDKSSDDSLSVIPAVAEHWNREINLLENAENSGSVFSQWRKAAETAKGDWLWIAEADDLSDPRFISHILTAIDGDPSVVLGFSDSRTVTADGSPLWDSYKPYYSTVEPNALSQTEIFDASEFVGRFLSVKNVILNVSAVIWRREALLRALEDCAQDLYRYQMAGDWRLYLQALSMPGARIAYEATPLNVHRRHAQSVTRALDRERHISEISYCHAFARQVAAGPNLKERQLAYIDEVTNQLNTTAVPKSHHSRIKAVRPTRRRSGGS